MRVMSGVRGLLVERHSPLWDWRPSALLHPPAQELKPKPPQKTLWKPAAWQAKAQSPDTPLGQLTLSNCCPSTIPLPLMCPSWAWPTKLSGYSTTLCQPLSIPAALPSHVEDPGHDMRELRKKYPAGFLERVPHGKYPSVAPVKRDSVVAGARLPVVPEGDCTLEWPTQGWLTLSPEERLEEHLKLEALLEAGWYGGDSQLSQWDRHAKYVAFELPGAARLSLCGATEAQVASPGAAGAYLHEVWPVEGDASLAPPAGGGGNPLPAASGGPGIRSPSPPTLGSLTLGVLKKRKRGRQ